MAENKTKSQSKTPAKKAKPKTAPRAKATAKSKIKVTQKKVNKAVFVYEYVQNELAEPKERLTNIQLAKKMGICEATYYNYVNDYIDDINKQISALLPKINLRGLKAILRLLDDKKVDADIAFKCAEFGRSSASKSDSVEGEGGGNVNKTEVVVNLQTLGDEEVEERAHNWLSGTRTKNTGKSKKKA